MDASANSSLRSLDVQTQDQTLPSAAPYGVCDWCGRPKVQVESLFAGSNELCTHTLCLFCFNQGRREHGWD